MKSFQDKYWEHVMGKEEDMLSNVFNFLSGKKTYIIVLIGAVLNLSVAFGWVSVEQLEQINAVLLALGLGALRAGISKVE